MVFGRCFEKALAAYFQGNDCTASLFQEWGAFRDTPFEYKKRESWDRLVHQGVHLLERFARMIASEFTIQRATCRSSWPGSFPETTNSWPTSTPWANSMANAA